VVRELVERGDEVRVTYRDERRLARLDGLEAETVKADVTDRAAMRRAVRGCDLLFHTAGRVGSKPPESIWRVNALGPRVAVEAAAAEGVGRVVVTSSVGGIGPAPPGQVGTEDDPYTAGPLGLTYVDSKHEGEVEAVAAGARLGVEVVVVNPSYVLGVPVDRSQPGETSTRMIGNYLAGRLPAVVDGHTNLVDVRDVAVGHLRAAERGEPGERYILGGQDIDWVGLIDLVGKISGVHHPIAVIPPEMARAARRAEWLHVPLPISAEGLILMAQNWRYSSTKARGKLGYRPRDLIVTLEETIEWYRELIDSGRMGGGVSPMSLGALGMRMAERSGLAGAFRLAGRYAGRRLVAGE
jgi:dihydroflavonol-4-reductase